MLEAFIHGFLLAFGLIVPLGVQNIFVFNQGAAQPGILRALPSVVTAAFCDTVLILLAVLGVSLIVLQIAWLKTLILGVGVIFLLYMGFVVWRSKVGGTQEHAVPMSARKQIVFAMSVSILNPHAFLDTIAVIGTNSLKYYGAALMVYTASCIIVSWSWFIGLAFAGHMLHRLDKNGVCITIINKVAAVIMWVVAIYIGNQMIA